MRRLISQEQYAQLNNFRGRIAEAVKTGNHSGMYHAIGLAQGYLLGLQDAGEIDADILAALETETFAGLDFLLNARKAAHAH